MRHIEPDTHITVGQDRTVFYNRAVIDATVTFDVAAPGDQGVFANSRSAANICRRYNARALVKLRPVINPYPGSSLAPRRTGFALSAEDICDELPQLPWSRQAVHVGLDEVEGSCRCFRMRRK